MSRRLVDVALLSALLAVGIVLSHLSALAQDGGVPDVKFRSELYAYEWRLPAGWAFTDPGPPAAPKGLDRIAALRRAPNALVLLLVANVPLGGSDQDAEALAQAQSAARERVTNEGGTEIKVEKITFLGGPAAYARGIVPNQPLGLHTATLFFRGHRRFEIVCYATPPKKGASDDPCAPAFQFMKIADQREPDGPIKLRRGFKLHDSQLGVSYSPPDETWPGFGPRTGMGGILKVWSWAKPGRGEIDVGVMDVADMPPKLTFDGYVKQMAENYRRDGSTVVSREGMLAGAKCSYLEVSRDGGEQLDVCFQQRGKYQYSLMVIEAKRDPELVRRAFAGFRALDQ